MDYTYLMQKYDQIKKGDQRYALVQINIKNFRYFNSRYGSIAGEEILQLVFERILEKLEDEEYGGRLYGDNFAILLKYENTDTLIYQRLIHLIDRVYRIEDERIYRNMFTSMGIFIIENGETSFNDALNNANLCRKESPDLLCRSTCMEIYDNAFRKNYLDRLVLEEETAEAYKNYKFTTFLQPKIDLKTGEIVGAEALLRWFDEDGNNIPLYRFLPILNQNGYIVLIDLDIFEQMCQFMEQRIKDGKKVVPISFNISKSYFYDENIIQDYINVFNKYNLSPELIEIELMESISLDDTEHMKKVVEGFKELGFTCALDDFGNGYSSFNVLLNAELDIIKMDRQFFLKNLNGDGELIIKTVVDLIHSLEMKVVAEGVENKEHIDFLKKIGCDYVQGYYYYKPMSVDDFTVILDNEKKV